MAKTVVGLFDNYNEAQSAVNDLINAGFNRDEISLVAHNTENRFASGSSAGDGGHGHGHGVGSGLVGGAAEGAVIGGLTGLAASLAMLLIPGIGPVMAIGPLAATLSGAGLGAVGGGVIGALSGLGIPHEEAGYYAEGIRRGGSLVAVKVDDARADEASAILNRYNPVDIDHRGGYYRETGYTSHNESLPHYDTNQINEDRTRYNNFATSTPAAATTNTNMGATNRTVQAGEQVTVPVVEEQLQVGKRQVQGGGARIHTHVIETPVQEQVTLREEHVTVNRQAVDRPVSQADMANALQDRTIEVTETAEQAVVAKQARVVEEVTIGKQATERTETVQDTVRRTDVDVQELDEDDLGTSTRTTTGSAVNGRQV